MRSPRVVLAVFVLLLLAGCGGTDRTAGTRERRTQVEVTARLRLLIDASARAIVASPRLTRGSFGGPIIVPCQDEGPVRTVSVSETYVIANTARDSAPSYVPRATRVLRSRGFHLTFADKYGVGGRRADGYAVEIASSPSGRPSVTAATPCVPPTDPKHPVGL